MLIFIQCLTLILVEVSIDECKLYEELGQSMLLILVSSLATSIKQPHAKFCKSQTLAYRGVISISLSNENREVDFLVMK